MPVSDYNDVIDAAGKEWNVHPNLLRAMMGQESGGKPNAVSSKGATGLMQIMPGTASQLGVTDSTDPVQSIYGGAKYMSQMLDRYQDPHLALAAYNAGPSRVDQYLSGKGTLPAETKAYVPSIAAKYATYQQQQQGQPQPQKQNSLPSDDEFLAHVGVGKPANAQQGATPSDDEFMAHVGVPQAVPAPSAATPQPTGAKPQPDYTGWDVPGQVAPNGYQAGYNALSTAIAPAPNTTYGNILPFAKDNATGAIRMALPTSARDLLQGGIDLAYGPAAGTVTPRATMALANVVPGVMPSPASGTGAAIADLARNPLAPRVEPQFNPIPTGTLNPPPQASIPAGPTMTNPLLADATRNPLSPTPPVNSPVVSALVSGDIPKTSQAAKAVAGAYYKQAEQAGGNLTPQFTNRFLDNVQAAIPQTAEGKAIAGDSAVTDLIGRMESLRDQPISLKGAQEIDEGIGNLIDKEFGPRGLSKDGKNLLDLQTTFRDMVNNATPEDTGGGPAGFSALSSARKAWSQAMKMSDLERIANRANMTDNPATGIKSGVNVLLSNRTRARGYDDGEIQALRSAGERGVLGGALHVFGSRLVPLAAGGIVGSASGPIGGLTAAGVTHLGSSMMRSGASYLQNRRLNNALSILGQSVPPMPGAIP